MVYQTDLKMVKDNWICMQSKSWWLETEFKKKVLSNYVCNKVKIEVKSPVVNTSWNDEITIIQFHVNQ